MITAHFYKMGRAAAGSRSRGKSYSRAKCGSAARKRCNRQALQLFELLACNGSLSLGGSKGPFSFAKENGPLIPLPARRRGTKYSAAAL